MHPNDSDGTTAVQIDTLSNIVQNISIVPKSCNITDTSSPSSETVTTRLEFVAEASPQPEMQGSQMPPPPSVVKKNEASPQELLHFDVDPNSSKVNDCVSLDDNHTKPPSPILED